MRRHTNTKVALSLVVALSPGPLVSDSLLGGAASKGCVRLQLQIKYEASDREMLCSCTGPIAPLPTSLIMRPI